MKKCAVAAAILAITLMLAVMGWYLAGREPAAAVALNAKVVTPAAKGSDGKRGDGTGGRVSNTLAATVAEAEVPSHREQEQQGFELALKDMSAAMAELKRLPEPGRASYLQGVLKAMAKLGLEAVRRLDPQGKDDDERYRLAAAVYLGAAAGLADAEDRKAALLALTSRRLVLKRDDKEMPRTSHMLIVGGAGVNIFDDLLSPPFLKILAESFGAAPVEKMAILTLGASYLVGSDPGAAFALGDGLPENEHLTFAYTFASEWAVKDADAAWAWAAQISDPKLRGRMQINIIAGDIGHDLPGRLRRFEQLEANSSARQDAIGSIAGQWARADAEEALQWIRGLDNPKEREQALMGFDHYALSDIWGSFYWTDSQGSEPRVGHAQRPGPSLSAPLGMDDKIVAVATKPNVWVPTKGLRPKELHELLQMPARKVWLQVQPANAVAGLMSRTVVVTRQWTKTD